MFRTLAPLRLLGPALLAATLATSTPLQGQRAPAVLVGERVRLWTPDAIEGTVIRATADTILLETATPAGVVAVPGHSIEKVQRRVRVGRYTLMGAGVGLLAGVGIAAATAPGCAGDFFSAGDCFVLGSVVLGPPGALLGGLVGYAIPRHGWREFRLPQRPDVSLDPRGGVSIAVSASF